MILAFTILALIILVPIILDQIILAPTILAQNQHFPYACVPGCLRDSDKDWNDHGVWRDH